jgi:hypothetical protein
MQPAEIGITGSLWPPGVCQHPLYLIGWWDGRSQQSSQVFHTMHLVHGTYLFTAKMCSEVLLQPLSHTGTAMIDLCCLPRPGTAQVVVGKACMGPI